MITMRILERIIDILRVIPYIAGVIGTIILLIWISALIVGGIVLMGGHIPI